MNNVLEYLENTVLYYPDKVAIEDEKGYLTFAELRKEALAFAKYIERKLDGRRRKPVLVYLPKGKECIVAFLGIVYSGNIYTPTDVKFPLRKTQEIINCLEPTLIISDSRNVEKLLTNGVCKDMIVMYEQAIGCNDIADDGEFIKRSIDVDPVYVFFTSGSTGTPKGVIITHRNIIDYIEWAAPNLDINHGTIMGNQSPLYFDISTQDIYVCLKTAATLVIIPELFFAFPTKVLEFIKEKKINFLYWVPSAFINVCNRGALDGIDISCVRQIVFGGEIMPVKYLKIWQNAIPGLKATNVYGPTETTVNVSAFHVDREFDDDEQLPLGSALDNTELIILSNKNEVINEINVKGELCVRGSCLSPGYWKNSQKTSEVFTQSVYMHIPERMYHTGDIVHYNYNHELVFDGRMDFQIKHLGYRIELAEIERAALSILDVLTVVADYDKSSKKIVLFYTSENMTSVVLKKKLAKILPKYMVPTVYHHFDELPYNENGKIDRKLLHIKFIDCNQNICL